MAKLKWDLDRPTFVRDKIWTSAANGGYIFIIDPLSGNIDDVIITQNTGNRSMYGYVNLNEKVICLPGMGGSCTIIDQDRQVKYIDYPYKKQIWCETYAAYLCGNKLINLPFASNYIELCDLGSFKFTRQVISEPYKSDKPLFSKRFIACGNQLFLGSKNAPYLMRIDTTKLEIKWIELKWLSCGIKDITCSENEIFILGTDGGIYCFDRKFELKCKLCSDLSYEYEFIIKLRDRIICIPRYESGFIVLNDNGVLVEKRIITDNSDDGLQKFVNYGDLAENDTYIFAIGRFSDTHLLINKTNGKVYEVSMKYTDGVKKKIISYGKNKNAPITEGVIGLTEWIEAI